jgi:hypothetical protein
MLRARFGARVMDNSKTSTFVASALVLAPTLCVVGVVGFLGSHFCEHTRKQADHSDKLDEEWRSMLRSPDFDAEHGVITHLQPRARRSTEPPFGMDFESSESEPPPWRIFVK